MKQEQARKVLQDAGYYTGNLWHVNDVMMRCKCDKETAMQILEKALNSERIIDEVFFQIWSIIETENLETIETND